MITQAMSRVNRNLEILVRLPAQLVLRRAFLVERIRRPVLVAPIGNIILGLGLGLRLRLRIGFRFRFRIRFGVRIGWGRAVG